MYISMQIFIWPKVRWVQKVALININKKYSEHKSDYKTAGKTTYFRRSLNGFVFYIAR